MSDLIMARALHLIRRYSSTYVGPNSTPPSITAVHVRMRDMVKEGLYERALELYREEIHHSSGQLHQGIATILPSIVKACTSSPPLHRSGLQLHCVSLKTGSDSDVVVSNSFISMYAKFSDPSSARHLFDTMPHRDSVSGNSMINCYIQNGHLAEALRLFKYVFFWDSYEPKPELIASIVSICAKTGNLRLGREIHALLLVDERIGESVFLSTALVDMYLKCCDSSMAFRVFSHVEVKNEVSWTAMVSGCAANRDYVMSMDCFRAMQAAGVKPNRVTLIAVLPACGELGRLQNGKEIHGYAIRHGFDSESRLSAALIHMYCKFSGASRPARLVFERSTAKDVVIWSTLIRTYSQTGDGAEALKLFSQMRLEGIKPNSVTLLAIILACTAKSSPNHGGRVHGYILKSGFHSDVSICNSLINMYSKIGCLEDSIRIFKEMPVTDSISWSALISAYGLNGCGEEALQLFQEMQERTIEPDAITFLGALSACNHAGLVQEGQRLFRQIVKSNKIPMTMEHYACYIDLLGRAGNLEDACKVVRTMPMKPSANIWSSLVSSYMIHGRLEVAKSLAHQLIEAEPENAAHYALLSMVYAKSGNWVGVEELQRVMRVRGLRKCYGFSQIEVRN